MTGAEWGPIAAKMVRRWPHVDWASWESTGALGQYFDDLADLRAVQVAVALDVVAREGREFPPPAGVIRQLVIELSLDAPDWGQVKVMLIGRQRVGGGQGECLTGAGCEGSTWLINDDNEAYPCSCRAERLKRVRTAKHPLVTAFVAELSPGELGDLNDRTAEAQVREKWQAFLRRQETAERVAGLPTADLPALERLRANPDEPKQLAEVLDNVRPLKPPSEAGGAA